MNLRNSFLDQGYVVIRNALPSDVCEKVLLELFRFKQKNRVYFSQSTHSWNRSGDLTPEGFLVQSIQSPTKQWTCGRLGKAVQGVISSAAVSDLLSKLTGFEYFVNWQNMLFDKSTGTVDHADTWYLDTKPAGMMVALWIALEDIHQDAGRFFVIPESNHLEMPVVSGKDFADHYDYARYIDGYIRDHGLKRLAPVLRAGDVLAWHPFTIHGSYSQNDSRYSRKSLTAHFHPVGMPRQRKAETPQAILDYMKQLRPTQNPFIYMDNSDPSNFDFGVKSLVRHYSRILRGRDVGQLFMNREKVFDSVKIG